VSAGDVWDRMTLKNLLFDFFSLLPLPDAEYITQHPSFPAPIATLPFDTHTSITNPNITEIMSADEKNEQMRRACPELASPYAKYPMAREAWLSPDGTGPNSAPAFIPGANVGLKPDYVYGPGPKNTGYYHLLTRESYAIVYARASNEAPVGCCCFGGGPEVDAWDTTKRITYNRSHASRPDDQLAAQEAIKIAQQKAKNVYNATQNQQLVVHAVLLAT
jgi:hypothetical protein